MPPAPPILAAVRLGRVELQVVSDGTVRLDGGNVFGVVPRALWGRWVRPDRRNRVTIALNCLLLRVDGKNILLDTGVGTKHPPRRRAIYAMRGGHLPRALASLGLGPEDIHVVALTHLHFDHAGGCTRRDRRGRLAPVFPRARYLVQRGDWEEATETNERTRAAYYPEDFLPLHDAGLVELVEGDVEVAPGVWLRHTGGHTRGHQALQVQVEGHTAICLGDVLPSPLHLPVHYAMAWDLYPLDTLRAKRHFLPRAAEEGWLVLFGHGLETRAGRITPQGDRFQLHPVEL